MFRVFSKAWRPAAVLLVVVTLVCGLVYPLALTCVGRVFFKQKAQGQVLYNKQGKVVGSRLIGQSTTDPKYLISRPSVGGSASNLSVFGGEQKESVAQRVAYFKSIDPQNKKAVPQDLVTVSGSGVDPDISVEAAYYQASRIARHRNISYAMVKKFIDEATTTPLIGPKIVNVLEVNISLDKL
ncbi:MAG: potassium-transporting ATPase subunit C [Coriobacteriia bacterium]|nr:potassium-transporting ATPase subunit C [Coriobacteriia bacterium]